MGPEVIQLSRPASLNGDAPTISLPEYSTPPKDILAHLQQYSLGENKFAEKRMLQAKLLEKLSLPVVSGHQVSITTVVNETALTTAALEQEANAYLQHHSKKFFHDVKPTFKMKEIPKLCAEYLDVFKEMKTHKLAIKMETYIDVMRFQTYFQRFDDSEALFDEALALCPDRDTRSMILLWAIKLENLARKGQVKEAIKSLDRLQSWAHCTDPALYNPLLRALHDGKHHEEGDNLWIRMHMDNVDLNVESFNITIQSHAFRGEVERAFFIYRELHVWKLVPDTTTFVMLLHAAARGPWWVKGYENIVYDAVELMEQAEFAPNVDIYNAIISAFGSSADAVSAEYFFWEMLRKGIQPDPTTFIALLDAYANAQRLSCKTYTWKSRYVEPFDPPLSPDERDMQEIGGRRTAALMASGLYSEPLQEGRGTKNERKKVVLLDLHEDSEARASVMEQIRREAAELRAARKEKKAREREMELTALEAKLGPKFQAIEAASIKNGLQKGTSHNSGSQLKDRDLNSLALGNDEEEDFEDDDYSEEESGDDEEDGDDDEEDDDDDGTISIRERTWKRQWKKVWEKLDTDHFDDPFRDEEGIKGLLCTSHVENSEDGDEDESLARADQQINVLSVLDKPDNSNDLETLRKEVDKEWDFVTFGRAPPFDPTVNPRLRSRIMRQRAMMAFDLMIQKNIYPSAHHWNRLLAVHSESMQCRDADTIFQSMKEKRNLVNSRTYEYMVRMNVRKKDMATAVALKDEALKSGLVPSIETYGLIIRGYAHRQMLVEALKTLEEAASKGIEVQERNLKFLRSCCTNLGITHPNLPPNPDQWVKDLKQVRRNRKHTSNRNVQPLMSKMFHK